MNTEYYYTLIRINYKDEYIIFSNLFSRRFINGDRTIHELFPLNSNAI